MLGSVDVSAQQPGSRRVPSVENVAAVVRCRETWVSDVTRRGTAGSDRTCLETWESIRLRVAAGDYGRYCVVAVLESLGSTIHQVSDAVKGEATDEWTGVISYPYATKDGWRLDHPFDSLSVSVALFSCFQLPSWVEVSQK